MKLYGDNTVLAGQLLETTFALLCNAGRQPVDILGIVYGSLTDGLDVSPRQREALHECLRSIVAEYDARRQTTSLLKECNHEE